MTTKAERREARITARLAKKAAKELANTSVKIDLARGVGFLPEETETKRKKRDGVTICGELFIKSTDDVVTAYMDWHDGSTPKVVEVKKGDYLRIKLTVEV